MIFRAASDSKLPTAAPAPSRADAQPCQYLSPQAHAHPGRHSGGLPIRNRQDPAGGYVVYATHQTGCIDALDSAAECLELGSTRKLDLACALQVPT